MTPAGGRPGRQRRQRRRRRRRLAVRGQATVVGIAGFCVAEQVRPARLAVRNGVVVRVVAVDGGATLPAGSRPSIDALFERAVAAARAATGMDVRSDAAYHYRTRLVIGTRANDAGVAYAVSQLVNH